MTLLADGNGKDSGYNPGMVTGKGRPIIFTPERMDQIRNLVERGHKREEIAEIIGCTLGSLQVTCSKAGVSLRRQRELGPAVKAVKRTPPVAPEPPKPSDLTRDPNNVLVPPGGWPPGHPWSGEPKPSTTFTLRITYGTRVHDVPIAIDSNTLCELACVADMNSLSLSETIARAIVAGVRKVTS